MQCVHVFTFVSLVVGVLLASLGDFGVLAFPPNSKGTMRAEMGYKTSAPKTTTTTTTAAPRTSSPEDPTTVKTTRKPYNCSESHRPHKNDTNKFQVRHNNVWWDQVCQTGLVWNQTLCRCEYSDEYTYDVMGCPDYRPHANKTGKYEQLVNGAWMVRDCNLAVAGLVWNQTSCRCEWGPDGDSSLLDFEKNTPCDTMLNVTFENGLVDDAKSSFLELSPGSTIALRYYQARGRERNKAAYFQDATMSIWYFAGNELSGSLRVELRFKAEDDPQTRDNYQILISNGCNVTGLGYTTPSLAIGYRASDKSFLLALHTANVRKAIVCTRDLEPFGWHHISLIYEDGTLLFRVDNHPCIISNDFAGDIQKTSCPLTIGSDPLEKESRYIGYLDDLMIARYCRRFVEQTFVPEDQHDEGEEEGDDDDDEDEMGPMPIEDSRFDDGANAQAMEPDLDKLIEPYRALL